MTKTNPAEFSKNPAEFNPAEFIFLKKPAEFNPADPKKKG